MLTLAATPYLAFESVPRHHGRLSSRKLGFTISRCEAKKRVNEGPYELKAREMDQPVKYSAHTMKHFVQMSDDGGKHPWYKRPNFFGVLSF